MLLRVVLKWSSSSLLVVYVWSTCGLLVGTSPSGPDQTRWDASGLCIVYCLVTYEITPRAILFEVLSHSVSDTESY